MFPRFPEMFSRVCILVANLAGFGSGSPFLFGGGGTGGGSSGGTTVVCGTTYDTVYTTVYDTVLEKQVSTFPL